MDSILNVMCWKVAGTSNAHAERAMKLIPATPYGFKEENESFSIAHKFVVKPGIRKVFIYLVLTSVLDEPILIIVRPRMIQKHAQHATKNY